MRPMEMSNREVEVKLRFASAAEASKRLESLGATLARPRRFEDNVVYDRPDRTLENADRLLRLRRVGGEGILTYKEPVPGEKVYKVRIEHETPVERPAALAAILEGLGFAPRWRYQKWRTVYALGGLSATVDETPLGCFVELEGEAAVIDRTAEALGFTPRDYIRATYRELQESEAGGPEAGDLLIDDATDGDRHP